MPRSVFGNRLEDSSYTRVALGILAKGTLVDYANPSGILSSGNSKKPRSQLLSREGVPDEGTQEPRSETGTAHFGSIGVGGS